MMYLRLDIETKRIKGSKINKKEIRDSTRWKIKLGLIPELIRFITVCISYNICVGIILRKQLCCQSVKIEIKKQKIYLKRY